MEGPDGRMESIWMWYNGTECHLLHLSSEQLRDFLTAMYFLHYY